MVMTNVRNIDPSASRDSGVGPVCLSAIENGVLPFQYTPESLAAADSPLASTTAAAGTAAGGFMYSLPSPSPTAPPRSLRLSADVISSGGDEGGSGFKRTVRALNRRPSVINSRGRRLEWDSCRGDGSPNSPDRRAAGYDIRARAGADKSPQTAIARGEGQRREETDAEMGRAAQTEQSKQGCDDDSRKAALSFHPQASDSPDRARQKSAQRQQERQQTDAVGHAANVQAGPGAGFFAALLENISLSQILPSQSTQGDAPRTEVEGEGQVESSRSTPQNDDAIRTAAIPCIDSSSVGGRTGGESTGDAESTRSRDPTSAVATPTRAVASEFARGRGTTSGKGDGTPPKNLWCGSGVGRADSLALDSEDAESVLSPARLLSDVDPRNWPTEAPEMPSPEVDGAAIPTAATMMLTSRPDMPSDHNPTLASTSEAFDAVTSSMTVAASTTVEMVGTAAVSHRVRVGEGPLVATTSLTGVALTEEPKATPRTHLQHAVATPGDKDENEAEPASAAAAEKTASEVAQDGTEVATPKNGREGQQGGMWAVGVPADTRESKDSPQSCVSSSLNLDLSLTPQVRYATARISTTLASCVADCRYFP